MKLSLPYERVVQWVAGPVSALIGFGATALITHVGVLGTLANGHEADISRGIVQAVTFGTTALATYGAHHKWLDNASKWWDSDAAKTESQVTNVVNEVYPSEDTAVATGIGDVNAMVKEILTGEAAQEQIQGMHGDDPATIKHFGAPDPEPVAVGAVSVKPEVGV
jgi:hypothetical protein